MLYLNNLQHVLTAAKRIPDLLKQTEAGVIFMGSTPEDLRQAIQGLVDYCVGHRIEDVLMEELTSPNSLLATLLQSYYQRNSK
jgi:hypothetical protein